MQRQVISGNRKAAVLFVDRCHQHGRQAIPNCRVLHSELVERPIGDSILTCGERSDGVVVSTRMQRILDKRPVGDSTLTFGRERLLEHSLHQVFVVVQLDHLIELVLNHLLVDLLHLLEGDSLHVLIGHLLINRLRDLLDLL
jgi:hypothetical protein